MNIIQKIRQLFAPRRVAVPIHDYSSFVKNLPPAERLIGESFAREPEKWFFSARENLVVASNRERGVSFTIDRKDGVVVGARCNELVFTDGFVKTVAAVMSAAHEVRTAEARALRADQLADSIVKAMEQKL